MTRGNGGQRFISPQNAVTADLRDTVLMAGGTFGALFIGLSNPVFNVLFGDMIDALHNGSRTLSELVAGLCIALVAVGGINIIAGFLQVCQPLSVLLVGPIDTLFLHEKDLLLDLLWRETNPKVPREVCKRCTSPGDRMVRRTWCEGVANPGYGALREDSRWNGPQAG
jgi:hypothetical protein